MVCVALNGVGLTQSSVIRIIHRNVGLKCFFSFTLMFVIIVSFSYIYISQGSVETHLLCGGICNNRIIANCLQSVPVKEFWKLVNNWRRYGHKQSGTFFRPTLYIGCCILRKHYSMIVFYFIIILLGCMMRATACSMENIEQFHVSGENGHFVCAPIYVSVCLEWCVGVSIFNPLSSHCWLKLDALIC